MTVLKAMGQRFSWMAQEKPLAYAWKNDRKCYFIQGSEPKPFVTQALLMHGRMIGNAISFKALNLSLS
ncbi:MAG: hypothetical protein ACUVRX_05800, partial [Actinomycetota bacterium]